MVGCDATRHAALEGTTPSSVEAGPKPPSAKVKRPWPTGQFMFIGGGEAIPGLVGIRRDCTGFVRCQFLLVAALRMNIASGKFVCLTWCVCSERSNCSTVCRPRRFLGRRVDEIPRIRPRAIWIHAQCSRHHSLLTHRILAFSGCIMSYLVIVVSVLQVLSFL